MKSKLLYLVILSYFVSCEAIFVENISTNQVVLLAPLNDSKPPKGIIQFNWQGVSGATQYEIQIAKPNFNAASEIVLDSITKATSISKNLAVGSYEWRVKSLNSEYTTPYNTQRFTIN